MRVRSGGLGSGLASCHWEAALTAREASQRKQAGKWQDLTPATLEPIVKYLKTQGVTLYFLPPYSPELNRIERFWQAMKFTSMVPKCRDSKMLEADVDEILDNFDTKYKFAF